MEKFGEYLKAQREKKGIRLEEIASITKIHLHALELLETGNWDQLPPEPFIRGFIIAYAKYVGLDAKETVARYSAEIKGVEDAPTPVSVEVGERKPHENAGDVIEKSHDFPTTKVAGGLGAIALVALVVIVIYVGKKTEPSGDAGKIVGSVEPTPISNEIPGAKSPDEDPRGVASPGHKTEPVKKEAPIAVGPMDAKEPIKVPEIPTVMLRPPPSPAALPLPTTVAATPSPSPSAASEEFKHEVTVEAKDRTWIKVVIDEKPPTELFLPPSEKTVYKAKSKVKIVLGNSAGATVTHNGDTVKGEKFQGTIRYYIFPANARFPQDKTSKRATAKASEPATESPAASPEASPEGSVPQ